MLLDDGVEILLHPEAAIRFQLVSEHGQPLPGNGLYLPQLTTITEADVNRYRDAFSYPTVDGWRLLVTPAHDNGGTFPYTPPADHAADPTAAPTVAHRTVAELVTWYQTASTYHKTPGQNLVLAIPGGGRAAAAAFAVSLGVPVIATTGSYTFTPDGRLLATHNGKPHYWTLYRPDNISHALAEDLVASINLADPRPTPVKASVPPHAASYPTINRTVNALPSPDGIVLAGPEIPIPPPGARPGSPLSPSGSVRT
ncbi:MAG: hypothetical protein QOE61_818 [Micromonosporaceae bacterium]|nr:hypothetical protein [Micromonosporaceae bacterium]